jgi:hypothetical protein
MRLLAAGAREIDSDHVASDVVSRVHALKRLSAEYLAGS